MKRIGRTQGRHPRRLAAREIAQAQSAFIPRQSLYAGAKTRVDGSERNRKVAPCSPCPVHHTCFTSREFVEGQIKPFLFDHCKERLRSGSGKHIFHRVLSFSSRKSVADFDSWAPNCESVDYRTIWCATAKFPRPPVGNQGYDEHTTRRSRIVRIPPTGGSIRLTPSCWIAARLCCAVDPRTRPACPRFRSFFRFDNPAVVLTAVALRRWRHRSKLARRSAMSLEAGESSLAPRHGFEPRLSEPLLTGDLPIFQVPTSQECREIACTYTIRRQGCFRRPVDLWIAALHHRRHEAQCGPAIAACVQNSKARIERACKLWILN